MSPQFEEIAADAMKLPVRDRVRLAQKLVATLEDGQEEDIAKIEALWFAEAQRRFDELRTGSVTGLTSDEAFQKARDALKR